MKLAAETKCPIYFHSVPAAVPMYLKAGFHEVERISMPYELQTGQYEPAGSVDSRVIELVAMTNDAKLSSS